MLRIVSLELHLVAGQGQLRREGLGIMHHFSKGKESINADTPFRSMGMITEVGYTRSG